MQQLGGLSSQPSPAGLCCCGRVCVTAPPPGHLLKLLNLSACLFSQRICQACVQGCDHASMHVVQGAKPCWAATVMAAQTNAMSVCSPGTLSWVLRSGQGAVRPPWPDRVVLWVHLPLCATIRCPKVIHQTAFHASEWQRANPATPACTSYRMNGPPIIFIAISNQRLLGAACCCQTGSIPALPMLAHESLVVSVLAQWPGNQHEFDIPCS